MIDAMQFTQIGKIATQTFNDLQPGQQINCHLKDNKERKLKIKKKFSQKFVSIKIKALKKPQSIPVEIVEK